MLPVAPRDVKILLGRRRAHPRLGDRCRTLLGAASPYRSLSPAIWNTTYCRRPIGRAPGREYPEHGAAHVEKARVGLTSCRPPGGRRRQGDCMVSITGGASSRSRRCWASCWIACC